MEAETLRYDSDTGNSLDPVGSDVGPNPYNNASQPAQEAPEGLTIHGRKIPEHIYDEIRKRANRKRTERSKQNKRAKLQKQREEEKAALEGLTEEEKARLAEERAAAEQQLSQQRIKAHLEQVARVEEALKSGLRVVVDCSFSAMCSSKEVRSLAKQLEISAGCNKRAARPVALTFTSFCGPLADFSVHMGSPGWKAHLVSQPFLEAFPSAQVVVLSPDAEEPLLELRQEEVYCIGGLVDRSVQKNVTLTFAEEKQLRACRLPVLEHAEQLGLGPGTCRKPVLNVNDVVLALLEFHSTGDWVKALDAAIPGRKKKPKTIKEDGAGSSGGQSKLAGGGDSRGQGSSCGGPDAGKHPAGLGTGNGWHQGGDAGSAAAGVATAAGGGSALLAGSTATLTTTGGGSGGPAENAGAVSSADECTPPIGEVAL